MSTLIVVFHKPDDDQAGELNDKLRQRGTLVDHKNRVGLVDFPDGCLIVCYDDAPDDQMKEAIRDKVKTVQPEMKILLMHRTTRERNANLALEQISLTLPGSILEGADCNEYSHTTSDELYKGLTRVLSENKLAVFFPHLEKSRREAIVKKQVSNLKHKLAHLFLPIDIDLQGWKESGFSRKYGEDIGTTYQGQAEKILEQARKLIYGVSQNSEEMGVQQIVAEVMSSVQEDQKEEIDGKWRRIQNLLPSREALLSRDNDVGDDSVRNLFATAVEILKGIQNQTTLDGIKSRLQSSNPFHKWVVEIDSALEVLRNALKG